MMFDNLHLAFIPIFFAVDPMGLLPLFTSLTHGLKRQEKQDIIIQSILTAICLALGFIFLGKFVFKLLGITVGDFMIAGGGILFCISIVDIMNPSKQRRIPGKTLGAVPLGTPLIVGPAVLTTSLMMIGAHGLLVTVISVVANILLVGVVLLFSEFLIKVLGDAGSQALSKVTSLFLAAIAVMMIRKGIMQVVLL